MKRWMIWIFVSLALAVFASAGAFFFSKRTSEPPVVAESFIDIDKIEKISKFRSCQGHAVIPQDGSETKRNMKHYVLLKPEYIGTGKVELRAPFDGYVMGVRSDANKGLEGEITLGLKDGEWSMSLLHLNVLSTLKEKQKVRAGNLIGYAADKGVDVVYSRGAAEVKTVEGFQSPYLALDSVFNHLGPKVTAQLQDRGVSSGDLSYTKEYRDSNPCRYLEGNVQSAQLNDYEHPEDWVVLK